MAAARAWRAGAHLRDAVRPPHPQVPRRPAHGDWSAGAGGTSRPRRPCVDRMAVWPAWSTTACTTASARRRSARRRGRPRRVPTLVDAWSHEVARLVRLTETHGPDEQHPDGLRAVRRRPRDPRRAIGVIEYVAGAPAARRRARPDLFAGGRATILLRGSSRACSRRDSKPSPGPCPSDARPSSTVASAPSSPRPVRRGPPRMPRRRRRRPAATRAEAPAPRERTGPPRGDDLLVALGGDVVVVVDLGRGMPRRGGELVQLGERRVCSRRCTTDGRGRDVVAGR